MALSRSPSMAWAVSARTEIWHVAASALRRQVASQPSISGRLMSIRIRSGASDRAKAKPWMPSTARMTSNPFRSRRLESMSRLSSLSSTNSTLGMIGLAVGPAILPGAGLHQVVDLAHQLIAAGSLLLEDLLHATVELLVIGLGQDLARHDHYGDGLPRLDLAELPDEFKAVHHGHRQVEHDQIGPAPGHLL